MVKVEARKIWFMVSGIVLIFLGMVAITLPVMTAVALESMLGVIFLLGGAVQVVHSMRAKSSGRCFMRMLGGLFYLVVGVTFLVYPLEGVITLTLLLFFLFMFEGVIKISLALQLAPSYSRRWMFASGAAALVIAAVIWRGWPGSSEWVIGLLVGINLIFSGWSTIMLSAAIE